VSTEEEDVLAAVEDIYHHLPIHIDQFLAKLIPSALHDEIRAHILLALFHHVKAIATAHDLMDFAARVAVLEALRWVGHEEEVPRLLKRPCTSAPSESSLISPPHA